MHSELLQALFTGLKHSYKSSYAQIDALLSLVPELAHPKVSLGGSCMDQKDGKMLTVLGSSSSAQQEQLSAPPQS